MLEQIMNIFRDSTAAPARPALVATGESRPVESHPLDALLAALFLLLGLLLRVTPGTRAARAIAARAVALLRAWFHPRARAATPEQHARALRHLRRLHTAHPLRTPGFRATRAARRRAARCWRLLVTPARRRPTHPRPVSAPSHPHQARAHPPHPRARPPPPRTTPQPAPPSHAHLTPRYNIPNSTPGTPLPAPHLRLC
jgi:hypothetical protein